MSESLQYARLAHRLIRQLCEAESSSTDDTPLELKQVALILEAFDEVVEIVEKRINADQHQHSNPPDPSSDEGLGEIG